MNNTLLIETTYKGKSCLPCVYMHAAVVDILPAYTDRVTYNKVDLTQACGKRRYLDLSCSLFGRKGVFKHCRLAPVPSLFINGELVFDAIPSRDELEEVIEEKLRPSGSATRTDEYETDKHRSSRTRMPELRHPL